MTVRVVGCPRGGGGDMGNRDWTYGVPNNVLFAVQIISSDVDSKQFETILRET